MWELGHKEDWVPKNWCFWTVVLEKTLESTLDCKEIKSVNPKQNQPWIFIRRADAEAEASIFWPRDMKSLFIGKDPDAGKDWGQEEKTATEDEMVGWQHGFNGHEFEQTPGDSEGRGSLVCCSPWGCKELDTTETEQQQILLVRIIKNCKKNFIVTPYTHFLQTFEIKTVYVCLYFCFANKITYTIFRPDGHEFE